MRALHAGITVGSLLLLAGCVARPPMVLSSSFISPQAPAADIARCRCALRIVQITDDRLDPKIMGVVGGRTVRAPPNTETWYRSVMSGLEPMGIPVTFGPEAGDSGTSIYAALELKSAWVSSATETKAASAVLAVRYFVRGTQIKSAEYRGSVSRLNWDSGDVEIQRMVDEVMQQILLQVSADVRTLCRQTPPAATH